MTHKKHDHSAGVGAILGIATVAAIAGAYFLYGKDGKKHQRRVKSWALKFKAEVLEGLELAQETTEAVYHTIVDSTVEKYRAMNHIDHAELNELAEEIKAHWRDIKEHLDQK